MDISFLTLRHCSIQDLFPVKNVNDNSLLIACIKPHGVVKACQQVWSFWFSSSLSLCPVTKTSGVFSINILPSNTGEQSTVVAIALLFMDLRNISYKQLLGR